MDYYPDDDADGSTFSHEIGHVLGLPHPGGYSNAAWAYGVDAESLMGTGTKLRLKDVKLILKKSMADNGVPENCDWYLTSRLTYDSSGQPQVAEE